MNATQVAREAAERWHRFNLAYPEIAERALHETIEGAIKVCAEAKPDSTIAFNAGFNACLRMPSDLSVQECLSFYREELDKYYAHENQRPD